MFVLCTQKCCMAYSNLNMALNAYLRVTTCTVCRFGLESYPQVALKIEGRLIGGRHPSLS